MKGKFFLQRRLISDAAGNKMMQLIIIPDAVRDAIGSTLLPSPYP
jgi:hypothetical protein